MKDVETKRDVPRPLKAIFLKELRGALWWNLGALAALAFVLTVMLYLYRDDVSPSGIGLHQENVRAAWAVSVSVVAFIIGVLSWVFDVSSGRWGLLVHRPATRRQWFVGKTLAGLVGYLLAALIPLGLAAVWCATPGSLPGPFYPAMVLPPLVDILAGAIAYFAGALSVMARCRWRVGHVFWIPAAVLLVVLGVQAETLTGNLLVIAIGATLSAWTLSRYVGRHRRMAVGWATRGVTGLCFGFNLYAVVFLVVAGVAAILGGGDAPRSYLRLLNDGTPVWATYDRSGGVDALTEDGRKVELVGRDFKGEPQPGRGFAQNCSLELKFSGADWRLLANHYRVVHDGVRHGGLAWYFDVSEGRFLGYEPEQRSPVRQLTRAGFGGFGAIAGTDRFVTPMSHSAAPTVFSSGTEVLGVGFAKERVWVMYEDPSGALLPPLTDVATQAGRVVDGRGGGKAFSVLMLGNRLVRLSRQIDLSVSDPFGGDEKVVGDYTPDFEIPLPEAFKGARSVAWWTLLNGEVVMAARDGTAESALAAVRLSAAGQVEGAVTFPQGPSSPSPIETENLIAASILPPGINVSAGVLGWLPAGHRSAIFGIAAVSGVFGALIAGGLRYLRDGRATRGVMVWSILGLMLGPVGAAILLCVTPRPARVRCADCGRQRPARGQACPRCAAAFAPPARIGTELFA